MKRTFILSLALLILISASAFARMKGDHSLGGALEVGIPIDDDFNNSVGTGFGLTLNYNRVLTPDIVLIATTGYIYWAGEEYMGSSWTWGEIPVKGGVKYFFNNNFYGIGQLAFHIYSFSMEYTDPYLGKISTSDSETEVGVALGVGYEYPINDKMTFDANVRYELNDFDYLAIGAGLNWALGK